MGAHPPLPSCSLGSPQTGFYVFFTLSVGKLGVMKLLPAVYRMWLPGKEGEGVLVRSSNKSFNHDVHWPLACVGCESEKL